MEILFVTLTLSDAKGGTALPAVGAAELKQAGHEVSVYTTFADDVSRALENGGILVATDLDSLGGLRPDVIHSFHASTSIVARHVFPEVHLLQHLDGTLKPPSVTPSIDVGISAFTRFAGDDEIAAIEGIPCFDLPKEPRGIAVQLETIYRQVLQSGTPKACPPIPESELKFYLSIFGEHAALVSATERLRKDHHRFETELRQIKPRVDEFRSRFKRELKAVEHTLSKQGLSSAGPLTAISQPRSTELPKIDDYRGENLVFILGPPRSGTTWLLSLMKEHPQVAAATVDNLGVRLDDAETMETGIFLENRGLSDEQIAQRFHSLSEGNAGKIIVEKTPIHLFYADRIRAIFPRSALILVQRDGRDVVNSMLRVGSDSSSWWKGAPGDVEGASSLWLQYAEAALDFSGHHSPLFVRYEDLLSDTEREMTRLLDALGMSTADVLHQIEASRAGRNIPIKGVFRKGKRGGWQDYFSEQDVAVFKRIAGEMLIRLGYERDNTWLAPSR